MLVVGHRGAAGEAPENTIAGFRHAIKRGVRHVELDIQMTSDDQLVVIHDATLNRTTGVKGRVAAFNAAQLARFDARRSGPLWPHKRDTGVPTLERVLKRCPELDSIQVEVKSGPRHQMRDIAKIFAKTFATEDSAAGLIATSFNSDFLQALGEYAPHLSRGLISRQPDCVYKARDLSCDFLILHVNLCNPLLIAQARRSKLNVSVWTVNQPEMIRILHRLKIHSVITDYPSMAIPLLSSLDRKA